MLDGERVIGRFRELELESRGAAAGPAPADRRRPAARRRDLLRARAEVGQGTGSTGGCRSGRGGPGTRIRRLPPARPCASRWPDGTRRLMAHDAPTRLGEVEGVHQMRVATRRLRGDIGTFGPLIDEPWGDALVDELRWLGDLLGAVRDRDVQLASLASDDADLLGDLMQLRTAIATARDNAREELMEALAGSRYLDLLERMVQAARDPLLTEAADRPAGRSSSRTCWPGRRIARVAGSRTSSRTVRTRRITRLASGPRTCVTRPKRSVPSSPAAPGGFATSRPLPPPCRTFSARTRTRSSCSSRCERRCRCIARMPCSPLRPDGTRNAWTRAACDLRAGYPEVRDTVAQAR